jgi:hypothetical protein
MMVRVTIEFVVDVPNMDVAGDVHTRLAREHHVKVREMLQAVTGYEPFAQPGRPGIAVGAESVTWSAEENDWVGDGDDDEDDDDK